MSGRDTSQAYDAPRTDRSPPGPSAAEGLLVGDPRPARPVGRLHRLLALRLHPQQLDGVRTRARVDGVLADRQLPRGEIRAPGHRHDLDELEPLTAEGG